MLCVNKLKFFFGMTIPAYKKHYVGQVLILTHSLLHAKLQLGEPLQGVCPVILEAYFMAGT